MSQTDVGRRPLLGTRFGEQLLEDFDLFWAMARGGLENRSDTMPITLYRNRDVCNMVCEELYCSPTSGLDG
ncbi:hypothetical protein FVER14953_20229 [Fusarium verticillioides]|nr:hypothetical protein FVER14953_20229 [Fusarium verticillioides]